MKKITSLLSASVLAMTLATSALAAPSPMASTVAKACVNLTGPGRARCNHNVQARDGTPAKAKKIDAMVRKFSKKQIMDQERMRQKKFRSSAVSSTVSSSTSSAASSTSSSY